MKKIIENNDLEKNNNISKVLKGSALSILITLILLFVFSALLTYTNIPEDSINIVTIIITAISILVGGYISSRHIKKNGLLNGGLVGFIYILFIYLISSIASGDFSMNVYSVIMLIASVVGGMLGGIIGVNTSSR